MRLTSEELFNKTPGVTFTRYTIIPEYMGPPKSSSIEHPELLLHDTDIPEDIGPPSRALKSTPLIQPER
jgi:hypothetical protein